MNASLEDEKKAILERMHASRRAYRSRFMPEPEDHPPAVQDPGAFPRSHTFKFLTRHPYSTATGLLATLALVPRGSVRKAVKGGAAVTAGLVGTKANAFVMRHLLPSLVHLLRSRRPPR